MKRMVILDALRVLRLQPGHKYCMLGQLSDEVGWAHYKTVKGRPKGVTPKYILKPLVPRLSEMLGINVEITNDNIGEEVQKLVDGLADGGVLLLENLRFYKEEEKNVQEFVEKLASLADLYVNDPFGSAHRAHASIKGVTKFLKPVVAS